jgi:hypothetical protein
MLTGRTGCAAVLGLIALVSTACNNGTETDISYKAAINDHFKTLPVCIWSQPKKFPVQAATSDDAKTEGYDALTQEGLLTRTTAEKKVLIVAATVALVADCGRATGDSDVTRLGKGDCRLLAGSYVSYLSTPLPKPDGCQRTCPGIWLKERHGWSEPSWIEIVVVVWMSDCVTGRAKNKT